MNYLKQMCTELQITLLCKRTQSSSLNIRRHDILICSYLEAACPWPSDKGQGSGYSILYGLLQPVCVANFDKCKIMTSVESVYSSICLVFKKQTTIENLSVDQKSNENTYVNERAKQWHKEIHSIAT